MDVASLLSDFVPGTPGDRDRKEESFRYTYSLLQGERPAFEEYIAALPPDLLRMRFGGASEDAYFTALLSTVAYHQPFVDVLLAAVLNKLALQLTFQTRYLGSGRPPDVFVFDGDATLFTIAMANTNVAAGLLLFQRDVPRPKWSVEYPHIEITSTNLVARVADDVPAAMVGLGRQIGCLAVILPLDTHQINFSARYDFFRNYVTEFTTFIIAGPPSILAKARSDLVALYPEGAFRFHTYKRSYDAKLQSILLAENISDIPNLLIETRRTTRWLKSARAKRSNAVNRSSNNSPPLPKIESENSAHNTPPPVSPDPLRQRLDTPDTAPGDGITAILSTGAQLACAFVEIANYKKKGIKIVNYRPDEYIQPKPPLHVVSTAPLTEENRSRMRDGHGFPHNLVILKDGISIPYSDGFISTYLYSSGAGDIPIDFSFDARLTPPFAQGQDVDGERRSTLNMNETLHVDGPAMPLTFTPLLHTFFSHFLLQCFPRLLLIRELCPEAKIMVPSGLRQKQRAMIHLAGFQEEQILTMPAGVPVQVEELLLPRPWPLALSGYTAQIYEELIIKSGVTTKHNDRRRILISRDYRRTWRNMVNYDAIRYSLSTRFGFLEVHPETLTIQEEIELFHNAEIVAGAEGAGLYGAVYARPDASIVSFCDEDYNMPILASIAHVRGFNISHVFGESFRSDRDVARRLPYGHADFCVDPMKIVELIASILP